MFEALNGFLDRHYRLGIGELRPRCDVDLVGDTLMAELDTQIRDAAERERRAKRNAYHSGSSSVPDYSWLISSREDAYRLPAMRRFEIESLCREIRQEHVSQVIGEFRQHLTGSTSIADTIDCFIRVLRKHIDSNKQTKQIDTKLSMLKRISSTSRVDRMPSELRQIERRASFPSLRQMRSSRITPINGEMVATSSGGQGTSHNVVIT